MAELSHHDKVALLGRDYKDAETPQADLLTSPVQIAEQERLKKLTNYRNAAAAFAGVAAIIMVSNYKEASGPYQPNLEIAAGATLVVAAIAAVFLYFAARKA